MIVWPTEWTARFLCLAVLLSGVFHLLPAIGMGGAHSLQRLYGVETRDPAVLLLLRHRALLFGLIGLGLICAAVIPGLHSVAAAVALVSMIGFIVLARGTQPNAAIRRVLLIDWILIGVLVLAWTLSLFAS